MVVCFIIGTALITGLTEQQALAIAIITLCIFIFFSVLYIWKNHYSISKKPLSITKHETNLNKVKHRHAPRLSLVPSLIVVIILLIGIFTYNTYQIKLTSKIPETLEEFGEKYPEATDFVENYPKLHKKSYNMDISSEIQSGNIPLFIQWDKRWGYKTYGSDLLALTGCGPTCLSMVICGLTGNAEWNPYKVAAFSEEQGYYIDGEGTSWDLMTTGAQLLGLNATYGIVDKTYLLENLTSSTPMICSMYPGDFTYSGHFIVLTGIDSDGNIIVNDPNSPNNSKKHWSIEKILPQIRSIWLFQA